MRTRSLSFRLVVGAGASVALAMAIAAAVIDVLFENHVERSLAASLEAQLDGLITVTEINEAGRPEPRRDLAEPRYQQPLSGWYWQITPIGGGGEPVRSRSLWDNALDVPTGPGEERAELFGPSHATLFAVSRRITLPESETPYLFTVAADRAEITALTRPFTLTLVLSLTVLAVVLVVAVFFQVRYGLKPLRAIPRALAAIRSGQAERLTGDFPVEVEPLAEEINALIEHNAQVVERARTHVGNLAHALKTPLTVLSNEVRGDKSQTAEVVRRQTETMARQVEHYLTRARTAARARALGARTDVMPVAEDLARALRRLHGERGVEIEVKGEAAAFRGEREDLEEMIGNLVDNACKWAERRVVVEVAAAPGTVEITVEDDGPGLKSEEWETALTRGRRLDESKPGSGLGLAIVTDVATLYGGAIVLNRGAMGGLRAVLRLPAAV